VQSEYSVIIVTYNSAGWIGECLRSVRAQKNSSFPLEIIVVDNASADSTVSVIRENFPEVRLIVNSKNTGFASAVNTGVAEAKHTHLLILNPDTVVSENFLVTLNERLSGINGSAIVGCGMTDADGTPQRSCWKMPSLWTVLLEAFLPYESSLPLVTELPGTFAKVDAVSGGCMVIPKDVFRTLGGFDEKFFMYYEDFDLCRRASRMNIPVYYDPGSRVIHHVRKSTLSENEKFFMYVYESKLKYFSKHESFPAYFLTYCVIVAGIALRIPAYWVAGKLFSKQELLQLSKYHTFVLPKIIRSFSHGH
jgi:GT2 family glycosyltransferase